MERKRRYERKPLERKEEILSGAMTLFTTYGYEAVSMRDIAQNLNISLGLCYRYFDTKQELFDKAMDQYAKECCQRFLAVFHDTSLDMLTKMSLLFQNLEKEEQEAPFHDFFHRPENKELHELLGLRICKIMQEPILKELQRYEELHHIRMLHKELFVSFITYGQISILSSFHHFTKETADTLQNYIELLIDNQSIPV